MPQSNAHCRQPHEERISRPIQMLFVHGNDENVQHLIMDCSYAVEVWSEVLSHWSMEITLPSSIFDLHANWVHRYPGQLPKNSWFKAGWMVLPKLVCWQI